ncbi:MAG: hypothetical protein AAGB11_04015 [Pseudomonadota bacterium]
MKFVIAMVSFGVRLARCFQGTASAHPLDEPHLPSLMVNKGVLARRGVRHGPQIPVQHARFGFLDSGAHGRDRQHSRPVRAPTEPLAPIIEVLRKTRTGRQDASSHAGIGALS